MNRKCKAWLRRGCRWTALALGCLLANAAVAAELKLAAVFTDHMVLQREKPVAVWGWGDPGETIAVEFGGQKKAAQADNTGKWRVSLDPMKASAEPREMVVTGSTVDRQKNLTDILVGEVWLGSGQSNMAMNVSRAMQFEEEKSKAQMPQIRMFREESAAAREVQSDSKGRWVVCTPESVGAFSATLYFFGRQLHSELKVPIGLINSSVGGTPIESWIALESQSRVDQLKPMIEEFSKSDSQFNEAEATARYEAAVAKWKSQAAKAKAAGKPQPARPIDPREARKRRGGLGGLYNGKIAPLIPYTIRGVLWYQGEANSQGAKAELYQYQLALLVKDWRNRWGEELPFAWVQLPNFEREGSGWMLVREAMLKNLNLPGSGMAITVDIGEAKDIHPRNKQEVGRRLALWALHDVYGQTGKEKSGPLPLKHEVLANSVKVVFQHAESGLKPRTGSVTGFQIAGDDRVWHSATARIEGSTVFVSSPEVPKPVAVRYAWSANPECNLINGDGLPASPFRTDTWPTP